MSRLCPNNEVGPPSWYEKRRRRRKVRDRAGKEETSRQDMENISRARSPRWAAFCPPSGSLRDLCVGLIHRAHPSLPMGRNDHMRAWVWGNVPLLRLAVARSKGYAGKSMRRCGRDQAVRKRPVAGIPTQPGCLILDEQSSLAGPRFPTLSGRTQSGT